MESVELQSIESLAQTARATYPNTEIDMALVASVEPDVLDEAIKDVSGTELKNKQHFQAAKRSYEEELEKAGSGDMTESLMETAGKFSRAEEELESNRGNTELADAVRSLQSHLAWPMRTAATILSALAIGAGSGVYVSQQQPETYGNVSAKEAENFKEIYTKSPVAIGIIFSIMGGVAGNAAGAAMAGREARRRARRAIRKESELSN